MSPDALRTMPSDDARQGSYREGTPGLAFMQRGRNERPLLTVQQSRHQDATTCSYFNLYVMPPMNWKVLY
jgi:hypothetical protein